MSIKCKYSDIKEVYDWYSEYADEKMQELYNTFPDIYQIAYYAPSNANWAYKIGLVTVNGVLYKVVTVFGQVKAVMPANIPRYKSNYISPKTLISL